MTKDEVIILEVMINMNESLNTKLQHVDQYINKNNIIIYKSEPRVKTLNIT